MKLLEINYLRTYAILSIVAWHCFICPLSIWGLIEPSRITGYVYILGHLFIPDANMPLFTFISGYLFVYLYLKNPNKYRVFRSFLKVKIERLLIPFLVIGTLVNITMPERYLYMILDGEGSHLWFCMMLFWCFLIRWTVLKINIKLVSLAILIFSIMAIFSSGGNNWLFLDKSPYTLFGIRHAVYFYFFFVMGDWLYRYKSKLLNVLEGKRGWIILILTSIIYVGWALGGVSNLKYVSFLGDISSPAMFIITCYLGVLKLISEEKLKPNSIIDTICIYSFGIYVFHEWLSWGLYHQPFFFDLFKQYTIVYAFVFTLLDFGVSFVLTHYSLKTKVGRYLLL